MASSTQSSGITTPIVFKHKLGIDWFTGSGCKKHVIADAAAKGNKVVVGWTHPSAGCRLYGSCPDLCYLMKHMPQETPTETNPHGFPDFEGLYHTTLDHNVFPPYFDIEWTAETEDAYPWVNLESILADIQVAMWHMFRISLTNDDFIIADACGESHSGFKHSYHVLIRPASGPGPISMTKAQLKAFWQVCLEPKYVVQHPSKDDKTQTIIDPAPYGSNFDYRMIYQSKPGGMRPLIPVIGYRETSICDFMLDYLPDDCTPLSSQLPCNNMPVLPAQLKPLAPPSKTHTPATKTRNSKPPSSTAGTLQKPTAHNSYWQSLRARQFSWLTREGKLTLVKRVLSDAQVTDITPHNLEPDGSVYCLTDKKSGRACLCSPGERHISNNVICRLDRDGNVYYHCLAPAGECRRNPVVVGSWLSYLDDPAALFQQRPALVDVNTVHDAMHAMCTQPTVESPSYPVLKAVFELANFMTTTPLTYVRLITPNAEDSLVREPLHMTKKSELKDTLAAVKYVGRKQTKKGDTETLVNFADTWFEDPEHRTYTRMDFVPPPLTCEASVFNMFTGFDAEHWVEESSGDISGWKALVDLACSNDSKAAYILEAYFAQLVQAPGTNAEAGWVTSSFAKGAGKDTLLECIKQIIGGRYYSETASPTQELLGTHALGLQNKLLVHVNESEDLRRSVGKVRHLLTAKQVEINEKYMRQIKVRNLARWVVSGNQEGLVEHCRRWFQTNFSSQRVGDHNFWQEVHAWKSNRGNLKAVYEHLKKFDLSGVKSMQALFDQHVTDATHHSALKTADNLTQWLVALVKNRVQRCSAESAKQKPHTDLYTADLYIKYQQWGRDNNIWKEEDTADLNRVEFGRLLSYRYSRTGRADPAMLYVEKMGQRRAGGFRIFWDSLLAELIAARYIMAAQLPNNQAEAPDDYAPDYDSLTVYAEEDAYF